LTGDILLYSSNKPIRPPLIYLSTNIFMKYLKSNIPIVLIMAAAISMQACKAKKKIVQSQAAPAEAPAQPVQQTPAPAPAQAQAPAPAPAPPNYHFSNIQFEFDSGILKTESYPALDKAAAEMKIDPSVNFILKGYASAEGSDAHNMQLSIDRANSVKAYLVNSGVSESILTTKGYGESNPTADNSTETGRARNRRVEIIKQ
jgi:OmpA-OmpF porin, OOP family